LIGSLNPAALIGKLKKQNLRIVGTGNLGATNTMLTFGKRIGIFVMLFDIFKSFAIVKIAAWIAPSSPWFPLASGVSAILGHCFPFYLNFKGGKGTAAFGGLVLAYNPLLFLFLLTTGILLMIIINHGIALPLYAAVFFAVFVLINEQSRSSAAYAVLSSLIVVAKNKSSIIKAVRKEDTPVRTYIKTKLFHSTVSK